MFVRCKPVYFKFGIYRYGTTEWHMHGEWDKLPDQTVYYNNVISYKPKKRAIKK